MKKNFLFLCLIGLLINGCTNSPTAKITVQMKESLKIAWTKLIGQFTTDEQLITNSWQQIEQYYTEEHRAYHNLTHINNMLEEAAKFDQKITDKEVVLLAIWFHDIIYDRQTPTRRNSPFR